MLQLARKSRLAKMLQLARKSHLDRNRIHDRADHFLADIGLKQLMKLGQVVPGRIYVFKEAEKKRTKEESSSIDYLLLS